MPILKNRTQNNFTIVSNHMFHDKRLSMRDRGVLCMLCSLPDGWEFSIAGLSAISLDGKDAIRSSLQNLESCGYLKRTQLRGEKGRFTTEIEVFPEGSTVADFPTRLNQHGSTDTDSPTEINNKIKKENKDINISTTSESVVVPVEEEEYEIEKMEMYSTIAAMFPDLTKKDIKTLIRVSGNNVTRLEKAKKILESQTVDIMNKTGWLIKAVRENYEMKEQKSKVSNYQKNRAGKFMERTEEEIWSDVGASSWSEYEDVICGLKPQKKRVCVER